MVPTWNYVTVLAQVQVSVISDREGIIGIIDQLSRQHESIMARPWTMDKLDERTLNAMTSVIIGLQFQIETLTVKAKLSQNRSAEDRQALIGGLRKEGASPFSETIANYMERL